MQVNRLTFNNACILMHMLPYNHTSVRTCAHLWSSVYHIFANALFSHRPETSPAPPCILFLVAGGQPGALKRNKKKCHFGKYCLGCVAVQIFTEKSEVVVDSCVLMMNPTNKLCYLMYCNIYPFFSAIGYRS